MGNMSYCRFQNTLNDLSDCQDAIYDSLSKEEAKARRRLIQLCREIAEIDDQDIENDTSED